MVWSSAEAFKALLEKGNESLSKGTLDKLVDLAVKDAPYAYKDVALMIEKQMKRCKAASKARLHVLYALSAICRQSKKKYGAKDRYGPRFAARLEIIAGYLSELPTAHWAAVGKIVQAWRKEAVFPDKDLVYFHGFAPRLEAASSEQLSLANADKSMGGPAVEFSPVNMYRSTGSVEKAEPLPPPDSGTATATRLTPVIGTATLSTGSTRQLPPPPLQPYNPLQPESAESSPTSAGRSTEPATLLTQPPVMQPSVTTTMAESSGVRKRKSRWDTGISNAAATAEPSTQGGSNDQATIAGSFQSTQGASNDQATVAGSFQSTQGASHKQIANAGSIPSTTQLPVAPPIPSTPPPLPPAPAPPQQPFAPHPAYPAGPPHPSAPPQPNSSGYQQWGAQPEWHRQPGIIAEAAKQVAASPWPAAPQGGYWQPSAPPPFRPPPPRPPPGPPPPHLPRPPSLPPPTQNATLPRSAPARLPSFPETALPSSAAGPGNRANNRWGPIPPQSTPPAPPQLPMQQQQVELPWQAIAAQQAKAALEPSERMDAAATAQELMSKIAKTALERIRGPEEIWAAQVQLPPPPKRSRWEAAPSQVEPTSQPESQTLEAPSQAPSSPEKQTLIAAEQNAPKDKAAEQPTAPLPPSSKPECSGVGNGELEQPPPPPALLSRPSVEKSVPVNEGTMLPATSVLENGAAVQTDKEKLQPPPPPKLQGQTTAEQSISASDAVSLPATGILENGAAVKTDERELHSQPHYELQAQQHSAQHQAATAEHANILGDGTAGRDSIRNGDATAGRDSSSDGGMVQPSKPSPPPLQAQSLAASQAAGPGGWQLEECKASTARTAKPYSAGVVEDSNGVGRKAVTSLSTQMPKDLQVALPGAARIGSPDWNELDLDVL